MNKPYDPNVTNISEAVDSKLNQKLINRGNNSYIRTKPSRGHQI